MKYLQKINNWFNSLPRELRFYYYMGLTAVLTLAGKDLSDLVTEISNPYVQAILTFVVINTIVYFSHVFGNKALELKK